MNKATWAIIIIVVVLLLGGGAWYYKNKYHTSSSTSSSSSSSSSSSGSSSTPTATNSVMIQNFAFSPADITVKKGTTVTWTNNDSATHTVTETDGKTGPDSGDLAPSKTYSFTYNTAGTFAYHCSIHASMTGTVTVTE
jgi:plastocyanin